MRVCVRGEGGEGRGGSGPALGSGVPALVRPASPTHARAARGVSGDQHDRRSQERWRGRPVRAGPRAPAAARACMENPAPPLNPARSTPPRHCRDQAPGLGRSPSPRRAQVHCQRMVPCGRARAWGPQFPDHAWHGLGGCPDRPRSSTPGSLAPHLTTHAPPADAEHPLSQPRPWPSRSVPGLGLPAARTAWDGRSPLPRPRVGNPRGKQGAVLRAEIGHEYGSGRGRAGKMVSGNESMLVTVQSLAPCRRPSGMQAAGGGALQGTENSAPGTLENQGTPFTPPSSRALSGLCMMRRDAPP